jgi:hypothetical protein
MWREFPDHPAVNLQVTSAASRALRAVCSGNHYPIPNIRAKFLCFAPKIVELSRYLPAVLLPNSAPLVMVLGSIKAAPTRGPSACLQKHGAHPLALVFSPFA